MKLVVGLGNPGEKYKDTWHNVGFMVIDAIIKTLTVSPHIEKKLDSLIFYHHASQTVFARPQTFMNSSGVSVKKLLVHFKIKLPNMWVIHDDLDLVLGSYKIQKGKGPREHGGLLSIYEKLETKNFWHVRIGVDNRTNNKEQSKKDNESVLIGQKILIGFVLCTMFFALYVIAKYWYAD